jgi:hypothetical protein
MASSQSQGTAILGTLAVVGVSHCHYHPHLICPWPLSSFSAIAASESIGCIQFARLGLLTCQQVEWERRKMNRFYHLALITASGKCKRPTHICSGVRSNAGLKE